MALEMKSGSKWWYVRYRDGKKICQIRLTIPIRGRVPVDRNDEGDRAFRMSKAEAQVEHDRVLAEIRGQDPGAEKAIQQLVALKMGGKLEFPLLEDLFDHWQRIPRRKQPNPQYVQQCKSGLRDFVSFVHAQQPFLKQFVQVTPELAEAYMEYRNRQGISTKTWNDSLKLLRATFKHLHPHLAEGANPFRRLVTRTADTVNRHPFKPDEMKKILDACAGDSFIRPIIIAGMCTAMRRGDCCLLRWSDVDLDEGFISVKTSKTGETVDIPILGLFRDELKKAVSSRDSAPDETRYVFPEQARMYETNPSGITLRVQRVLSEALNRAAKAEVEGRPELPADETRRLGSAYIESLQNRAKAERMRRVFALYMDGNNINVVAKSAGVSKGAVSGYLGEIESGAGCIIVRGRNREGDSFASQIRSDTDVLHAKRPNGTRRASVRDFHSFRVTWITIALAAGVPLEIVQRVTGHRTVDVVLKHYFRPGRDDFRRTLENAMPQLFLGTAETKSLPAAADPQFDAEELAALAAKLAAGSASEADRARFRDLAAGV